jgi:hypothetical protein
VEVQIPAGTIYVTARGKRVITLQPATFQAPAGETVNARLPAATLASKGSAAQAESAQATQETEPRLQPLLKFLASRKEVPRSTTQCAVLALLEDITFADWTRFRGPAAEGKDGNPLVEAVDALSILRTIAPEKTFRLATDPALKVKALHDPATRGKAGLLYGLTIPGDAPPGQTPPDLGQLLHTKPGDNCPVCRMRSAAPAPSNGL